MGGEPDDTVRIARPGAKPPVPARRGALVGLGVGAVLLLLAAGGAWVVFQPGQVAAPPAIAPPGPSVAPAPPPPAAVTTPAVVLPPLATEAEILARRPEVTEIVRFAPQPEIVVMHFASLAEQARMLNRAAALLERAGYPRDRVLDDVELDRRIRAAGDTPERVYLGHDYRASDLMRFFAMADQSGTVLTTEEERLRGLMKGWGWGPGTNAALISVVREDVSAGLDSVARATILRHELSHGQYFTNPAYAAYVRQFWDGTLTEAERGRFRAFLGREGYDTGIDDLMVNETQAYLMHTANDRFFTAAAVGIAAARIDTLRGLFLTGMPPGWLRDCTVLPAR